MTPAPPSTYLKQDLSAEGSRKQVPSLPLNPIVDMETVLYFGPQPSQVQSETRPVCLGMYLGAIPVLDSRDMSFNGSALTVKYQFMEIVNKTEGDLTPASLSTLLSH